MAALHKNSADFLFETTKTKRAECTIDVHDQSISSANPSTADYKEAKKDLMDFWCTVNTFRISKLHIFIKTCICIYLE